MMNQNTTTENQKNLTNTSNEIVKQKKQGIASYLNTDAVKESILSVLGEKDLKPFISSVVSAVQTNPALAECTKPSILSAALLGYSLKLPQSPQLAMFYMVPYDTKKKDKDGRECRVKEAQFQLSYRGYLNLAMRSGQYKKINVTDIKEGEVKSINPITEEYEFQAVTDYEKRKELPTAGYYAYFELANGYRKEIYWSKERMESHAMKYSKTYKSDKSWVREKSLWNTNFDDMAYKTLIRNLLSKWGILSVEMENAYAGDMAVSDADGNLDYVDNKPDEPAEAVDVYAEEVDEIEVIDIDNIK